MVRTTDKCVTDTVFFVTIVFGRIQIKIAIASRLGGGVIVQNVVGLKHAVAGLARGADKILRVEFIIVKQMIEKRTASY